MSTINSPPRSALPTAARRSLSMDSEMKGTIVSPRLDAVTLADIEKPHPSIGDYYRSARTDPDRMLVFQPGLKNFSSVELGDPRISFTKSMTQELYEVNEGPRTELGKLYLFDSISARRNAYIDAQDMIGQDELDRMEKLMRVKLSQKTASGPLQLRKNFKFFDRDSSGGIDLDEFSHALELMGFNFTPRQMIALFARYDVGCNGEIDYSEFITTLMERDFASRKTNLIQKMENMLTGGNRGRAASTTSYSYEEDMSEEQAQLQQFRREEVKKIFRMIDKDNSGTIDVAELEILMMALGRPMNARQIENGLELLDADRSGVIEFDEFDRWYNGTVTNPRTERGSGDVLESDEESLGGSL